MEALAHDTHDANGTQHMNRPAQAKDWLKLAALIAATAAWCAVSMRFGQGNVYTALGPYALLVVALTCLLQHADLARWFAPRARLIALGLGIGVLMTVSTYPVFQLAKTLVPSLGVRVALLYSNAHDTALPSALAWVTVIILAEELLFRGALPAALSHWLPQRAAFGVSLVLYALAQLGTGSLIVAAMALVCGSIWTVQRMQTNSLLSPLLAHLIWTPTVILLHPVT